MADLLVSEAEASRAPKRPISVLFVCLGNICRSPTAQAVFTRLVQEAGLEGAVTIDSAGTGQWHAGEPPDLRATHAAAQRGYDLTPLRARQVGSTDFATFDYVLAMDDENLWALKRQCPPEHASKVRLFTEFCSQGACTVPDPYGGGPQGFELVLDLVEDCAKGLLLEVRRQLAA